MTECAYKLKKLLLNMFFSYICYYPDEVLDKKLNIFILQCYNNLNEIQGIFLKMEGVQFQLK